MENLEDYMKDIVNPISINKYKVRDIMNSFKTDEYSDEYPDEYSDEYSDRLPLDLLWNYDNEYRR